MSETTIEVKPRELRGKGPNRRLRGSGSVPAVVYGAGLDPVPIQVETDTVRWVLRTGGENTVFLLKLEGTDQSRHAMIRDIQYDPRNGRLLHIDFQRILMDQLVRVRVPISITGLAEGVKNEGGMIDFITREVEVECLPTNIPGELELDVSELHVGQHTEAGALVLPDGVTLVDEADRVIVSVSKARIAEEEEEAAEEDEEGLIEAAKEEPELISKEKEGADDEG